MANYTLGTLKTIASYGIGPAKIVKVNTNTYALVWIRDSNNYSICSTYSYSNGIWSFGQGESPIFTGPAWFSIACPITLCKIDTDRILFTFCDGASYPRTRLVDMSITTIVDRGSKDLIGAAATWASITQIDTNKAVVIYKKTSDNGLYAVVVTVAGNVQSVGSPVLLDASTSSNTSVKKISTNKFAVLYDNVTDSKATVVCGTISGTVITPGTPKDIPGETGCLYTDIIYINDDKFILLYRDTANNGQTVAATTSGTVATLGTASEFDSLPPLLTQGIKINTSNFMLVYCQLAAKGFVNKGSVDWNTRIITMNVTEEWYPTAIGGSTDRSLGSCYIEENIGACFFQDEAAASYGKLISIQSNLTAPLNVAAVTGTMPGEIDISFDSVSGATSYNLYWAQITGVTKITGTKIAGITSPYTHTGRTSGQEYFYIITAVQNGYESDDSSETSAFPYIISSITVATPGDSENIITWDTVPAATSYDIYWSLEPDVTISNGTKIEDVESGYEHQGLTRQIYYYIVVSNVGGLPYESNEAYATPDFEGKIFNHNDQIKESLLYQYIGD